MRLVCGYLPGGAQKAAEDPGQVAAKVAEGAKVNVAGGRLINPGLNQVVGAIWWTKDCENWAVDWPQILAAGVNVSVSVLCRGQAE